MVRNTGKEYLVSPGRFPWGPTLARREHAGAAQVTEHRAGFWLIRRRREPYPGVAGPGTPDCGCSDFAVIWAWERSGGHFVYENWCSRGKPSSLTEKSWPGRSEGDEALGSAPRRRSARPHEYRIAEEALQAGLRPCTHSGSPGIGRRLPVCYKMHEETMPRREGS